MPKKEKIEEKRVIGDKNDHFTTLESISGKIDTVLKKLTNKTEPEEETIENKTVEGDVNLEKTGWEMKNLELERKILELQTENSELKNSIRRNKQDKLVSKALKLNKKLNPNTKIINKEALLEEVKSLSKNDNNLYLQLESYNKGLKLALKAIPEGDLLNVSTNTLDKSEIKLQEKILEKTRKLNELGNEE